MGKINLKTSSAAYKVLSVVLKNDEGSYGKEIEREADLSQGQVGDCLKILYETGLVKKGKRTRAQYYELDPEGLAGFLPELYLNDFSVSSEFQGFLQRYVSLYVRFNRESTVQLMLRDDLVTSLLAYRQAGNDLPGYVESFLESIGDEASGYDKRPLEIVGSALQE